MYGPESVLVPYLYDGPGAVVELEREAAVDHEASVEAPEAKQRFIFFYVQNNVYSVLTSI